MDTYNQTCGRLRDDMGRSKLRIYCWIRQQRHLLAVHKFIYYELSESIYEDLQFDYLEARLDLVEKRYPKVADAVTEEGYLSPSSYVDALNSLPIENRARRLVERWIDKGRPRIDTIPYMTGDIGKDALCYDALRSIVRYPI